MIVAGIASIPTRFDQLIKTVHSLYPQVDKINLSLNHYTAIPEELYMPNVEIAITQGTDEQKFRKVEGDIYLSCDDDLIYPDNYVETILSKIEKYKIVTFHGRSFDDLPIQSYYKSRSRRYRCLDKVSDDIPVQFGGTGCMAFKTSEFFLTLDDFKYTYMADIQVAIKARNEGKKIWCLAHQAGWIINQPVNDTIFERFRDNDHMQTQIANSMLQNAYSL